MPKRRTVISALGSVVLTTATGDSALAHDSAINAQIYNRLKEAGWESRVSSLRLCDYFAYSVARISRG